MLHFTGYCVRETREHIGHEGSLSLVMGDSHSVSPCPMLVATSERGLHLVHCLTDLSRPRLHP
jgi:hypothetical protein